MGRDLRKPLFASIHVPHFKARAGKRLPNNDTFKLELGLEISMIIKINAKSRYLLDKLLPLWGGNEINLTLADKLREDSTNDEVMATLLNDAGKTKKIYTKKRNSFQFPVVEKDTLILRQTELQKV